MIIKKSLLALALIIISLASFIVYAGGITLPGFDPKPLDGTVLTSTLVNFSIRVNNTMNNGTLFNLTVYNNSNRVQALNNTNWGHLFSQEITNASFFNRITNGCSIS